MSVLSRVQENLRFRLNSAQAMLLGGSNAQEAKPIERRKELMRRRRETLNEALPGGSEDDPSTVSADTTSAVSRSSEGSGQIGQSSGGSESRKKDAETTRPSKISTMSEVQRGTAERADEQGFGR